MERAHTIARPIADQVTRATSALLPVMAVVLVAFLVIGVALPALPLHVHLGLGLESFVVGLVTGSQFAASVLSGVWAGSFADTAGSKRAVIVGLVTAVVSGLLYLFSLRFVSRPELSVAILLTGRAVLGGAVSFIITGAVSWGLPSLAPRVRVASSPGWHGDVWGIRTSGLNLLKRWIEALQLHTGIVRSEVPVGRGVVGIATLAPSRHLACKCLGVRDVAGEALAGEHGEFGLGQIEPAAMLWRVVPLEALDDAAGCVARRARPAPDRCRRTAARRCARVARRLQSKKRCASSGSRAARPRASRAGGIVRLSAGCETPSLAVTLVKFISRPTATSARRSPRLPLCIHPPSL